MTRGQKVVLVGLALVVLVYAVLVWHGASQPACPSGSSDSRCQAGAGTRWIGSLTGVFAKGIKLPQAQYQVAPNALVTVRIGTDSAQLRQLKVKMVQGIAASLSYANVEPDQGDMGKQRDPSSLPRSGDGDRMTQTYAVTSGGGTLTLRCTGPVRCVFEGA